MKTRFVRSSRGFSPAAGPRTPLSAWTAVAMAGAASFVVNMIGRELLALGGSMNSLGEELGDSAA